MHLAGDIVPKDIETALSCLRDAANCGNQWAQYTLGKLYLLGREVPKDVEAAVALLQRAADQGNTYAQYFLDHRNGPPINSAGGAVLRMLHCMARIFEEQAVVDSTRLGMRIDKKRRREMLDKRLAMGHKIDDHEYPENNVNQTMRR